MKFDQDLEGLVYDGQEVKGLAGKKSQDIRLFVPDSTCFTYRSWKAHWKKGRSPGRMATMADIYDALYLESRGREGAAFYVHDFFRGQANPNKGLLADTRVDLIKGGRARITHGTIGKPQSQVEITMPDFIPEDPLGTEIDIILNREEGFQYLREIFSTRQYEKAILEVLGVLEPDFSKFLFRAPNSYEHYTDKAYVIALAKDADNNTILTHDAIGENPWGKSLGVEP